MSGPTKLLIQSDGSGTKSSFSLSTRRNLVATKMQTSVPVYCSADRDTWELNPGPYCEANTEMSLYESSSISVIKFLFTNKMLMLGFF